MSGTQIGGAEHISALGDKSGEQEIKQIPESDHQGDKENAVQNRFCELHPISLLFFTFRKMLCYDHAVDDVFLIIQLFQRRDWVQRHAALRTVYHIFGWLSRQKPSVPSHLPVRASSVGWDFFCGKLSLF